MSAEDLQLADFLLDAGLLSRSQLETAFERIDGKTLSSVLLEGGYIGEDELRRASAAALGIPFAALSYEDISPEALVLLPEPFCRSHTVVGTRLKGDALEVALLDMRDFAALDSLSLPPSIKKITPLLTDRASMNRALLRYQKVLKETFGGLIQRAVVEKQPAALVDALLRHALAQGASDIHIEERSGLLVRYRIGGVLRDAMTMPSSVAGGLFGRLKALARLPLHGTPPQEGRVKVDVGGEIVSIRVSILPVVGGERTVLHCVREPYRQGFALESLGFHGDGLESLYRALSARSGLVLVAGEEGSGKTTLLYTMLDLLASPERDIATLEERIESRLPGVSQVRVTENIGLSFASGLRALLRQDVDVIMISDLRDADTTALAVRAASRGKLVLASVTAPSAGAALEQLLGFGIDPFLLTSVLRVTIGVSLVKKLCDTAREYHPTRADFDAFTAQTDFVSVLSALKEEHLFPSDAAWKDIAFYKPTPCAECEDGYKGFIGVQEIIPASSVIAELMHAGASGDVIARAAKEEGSLSRVEDGIYKAAQGFTSLEDVRALARA